VIRSSRMKISSTSKTFDMSDMLRFECDERLNSIQAPGTEPHILHQKKELADFSKKEPLDGPHCSVWTKNPDSEMVERKHDRTPM
jgi:hypothetical protein